MRKITAHSRQHVTAKEGLTWATKIKTVLHINAATAGSITLSGITPDGEPHVLYSVDKQLHVKNTIEGYTKFHLQMTKDGSADITANDRQITEPMDREPAPLPIEQNNIIARMRQEAKQQMGIQREAFLDNDTGLPGYETEADYTFEEEEAEISRQIAQSNAESSSAGDKGGNKTASQTNKPAESQSARASEAPPSEG